MWERGHTTSICGRIVTTAFAVAYLGCCYLVDNRKITDGCDRKTITVVTDAIVLLRVDLLEVCSA